MVNSFLSPLTSENCLARDLSTQLYMKWILRPSLQASSDLSEMALLYFFFHNFLCISSIGSFPTWIFFSLRSGAPQPSCNLFHFSCHHFRLSSLHCLRLVRCVAKCLNGTLRRLGSQDFFMEASIAARLPVLGASYEFPIELSATGSFISLPYKIFSFGIASLLIGQILDFRKAAIACSRRNSFIMTLEEPFSKGGSLLVTFSAILSYNCN